MFSLIKVWIAEIENRIMQTGKQQKTTPHPATSKRGFLGDQSPGS
jgi:hypothetical protein